MSESKPQHHPPATPIYILRGHASPIHGLHIFHQNLRLISGDADGWVVVWDLVSKRPIASWKAHDGALLEVKGFSPDAATTEVYTCVLHPHPRQKTKPSNDHQTRKRPQAAHVAVPRTRRTDP